VLGPISNDILDMSRMANAQRAAELLARNHVDKTPEQWIRSLGMDEVADYMAERFTRQATQSKTDNLTQLPGMSPAHGNS
jgi:hypothetical protein